MSWQSTPSRIPSRLSPGSLGLGVAVFVGLMFGLAPAAQAGWGIPYLRQSWFVRPPPPPPDQSWLRDVPDKSGARSRGKIAVFAFKGDDVYEPVRAAVVRVLRRRGLNVTATLRPVDSAAQFREMSFTLNLAVFVEGELVGVGVRQSARIRIRSGVSGQRIASATFSGPTPKIVEAVGNKLWTKVGATMMRACSNASRPRRREREPLRIEAGTPTEDTSVDPQGT